MALRSIFANGTPYYIEAALEELPRDLSVLYEQFFQQIESQPLSSRTLAQSIISWILGSPIDMSASEICKACRFDSYEIPTTDLVLSTCNNMVSFNTSTKIFELDHSSVLEFIKETRAETYNEAKVQDLLACSCLRCLLDFTSILDYPGFVPPAADYTSLLLSRQSEDVNDGPDFLSYSYEHWFLHCQNAEDASLPRAEFIDLLAAWYRRCLQIPDDWINTTPHGINEAVLHAAMQWQTYFKQEPETLSLLEGFTKLIIDGQLGESISDLRALCREYNEEFRGFADANELFFLYSCKYFHM
jgi:hypothetical protein